MPERVDLVFKNGPISIDVLALDVATLIRHTGDVTITDHPVEEGTNVSDHARKNPNRLTITGIVSNTPLNSTQQKRIVESQGIRFESTSAEDFVQGTAGYAEAAAAVLRDLLDNSKLITVRTHLRVYTDMIIESLDIPQDRNTGDALQFTATFKQIRIVKNKTTRKVQAKETKAQPKAKAGKQTTAQANEAQKKKSIAYSTAEKLGLLEKMGIRK